MKPEEQRIAIAEACGWTWTPGLFGWFDWPKHPKGFARVPNYLNDLNAIREAEKIMTAKQRCDYTWHLSNSVGAESLNEIISATAAQRSEAFLKTIGKWGDGQ